MSDLSDDGKEYLAALAGYIRRVSDTIFSAEGSDGQAWSRAWGGLEDVVVATGYSRCHLRYQAIGVLIEWYLPDDALILMRSLLADSQRLRFIASRPVSERARLALRWFEDGVLDLESQAQKATQLADPELADFARNQGAYAQRLRTARELRQRRLGIERLGTFPSEGDNMAQRLGQPDEAFDYRIASASAHHTMSSSLRLFQWGPDGVLTVRARDPDAAFVRTVASRSTMHVLGGMAAAAEILGSSHAEGLARFRDERITAIRSRQEPP